jgi:spore germination protein GerM
MASRKKRKTRHKTNAGVLVFLLGLLVLVVLFVVKYPQIKEILDRTEFFKLVGQHSVTNTRKDTTSTTVALPPPVVKETLPVPGPDKGTAAPAATIRPAEPAPSQPLPPKAGPQAVEITAPPSTTAPASKTSSAPVTQGTPSRQDPAAGNTALEYRPSSLFFVKISEDGLISRLEVKRSIPVSDSPLTDALNALLSGPSEAEIRAGLISLIPRGTKLLGVTMRGSTAIVDLSDAFMYNLYGNEGFSAQLRQVVYTATSFSSVQDVQVLVEGKKKDYLGLEGIYIGAPLSRNSF